jgi:hypothetical protein
MCDAASAGYALLAVSAVAGAVQANQTARRPAPAPPLPPSPTAEAYHSPDANIDPDSPDAPVTRRKLRVDLNTTGGAGAPSAGLQIKTR